MRYYDTLTHTETDKESVTTIPQTDDRVKDFFNPLEDGYMVIYINDLPIIEAIPVPTQEEQAIIDALGLESEEWQEYLAAEAADKKDKWEKAGKPKFIDK